MLYSAEQCRKIIDGHELDDVTKELELVEKAMHEGLGKKSRYCSVNFYVSDETATYLKDRGLGVSLNKCNGCTYISWVS